MGKESETAEQFLERNNIAQLLTDLMTALAAVQPSEPTDFICSFFKRYREQLPEVKAVDLVMRHKYDSPLFERDARLAYELMMDYSGSRSNYSGLNGEIFSKLLNLLTANLKAHIREKLLRRIQCRSYEFVPFNIFKYGVFTCAVLRQFCRQADLLYSSLVPSGRLHAPQAKCLGLLRHLYYQVSVKQPSNFVASRHLQAVLSLNPQQSMLSLTTPAAANIDSSRLSPDANNGTTVPNALSFSFPSIGSLSENAPITNSSLNLHNDEWRRDGSSTLTQPLSTSVDKTNLSELAAKERPFYREEFINIAAEIFLSTVVAVR